MNVLVVEDELKLADGLARFLTYAGFHVRVAGTLAEAKRQLEQPFDAVLLDVRLPDGEGWTLIPKLKALRPAPVIILATARGEADDRVFGLELGIVKQEDVAATGRSMTEEVDRIDRLVTQMLEYSKLSAGKLTLTTEPVHLNELIEETVSRMEESFKHKQVTVALELEDVTVQADRLAMERILSNFLQNAYHASPVGGMITVRLTERRLEIEDEGPGIPESMHANIWNMYVKGDQSDGHGLGLAINKLLLEAQGLSYGIESREGALFWIMWD
ncbi:response regulator [Exiguobacterium alkaliphilum]|uniref:response regulator n=1 Tax=Exiguobacterium alkaliphilum TaxID=1428684 RepID=UPI00403AEEF5